MDTLLSRLAHRTGVTHAIVRHSVAFANSQARVRRAFGGYTPTGRDVFVATFMKSGTNWMMQIALQIAHRGEADFDHIHDLVPWPEAPSPGPIALDDPASWQGAPTGLRVIKTHGDAGSVPAHPDARYLVVLRDPGEVIVSAYHFALPLMGLRGAVSPDEWLRLVSPETGRNHWLEHTVSWWALRDAPNVEIFFYKDMKKDPGAAVDRVAALMGVSLTPSERAAVLERSSLSHMRSIQSAFRPIPLPFVTPRTLPDMIRRGESGGTRELYTDAQLAHVRETARTALRERCPDLPFGEALGA